MSSHSFTIPGVSLRFAIKWTLPVEKLKSVGTNIGGNKSLESNIYRFPKIGEKAEFSFHLTHANHYKMRVECKPDRYGISACIVKYIPDFPIFLEDVLILVDGRVYRAECKRSNTRGQLFFNRDVLLENLFANDEVTFHCIISIPLEMKTDFPYKNEEEEVLHSIVDCNPNVTELDFKHKHYDAVSEFEYSSRVPDFNVKMALNLFHEAHLRRSEVLEALCVEYLIENLAAENVAEVLSKALYLSAENLVQKCSDFISKECKVVPID